jgi:hypothetical protein
MDAILGDIVFVQARRCGVWPDADRPQEPGDQGDREDSTCDQERCRAPTRDSADHEDHPPDAPREHRAPGQQISVARAWDGITHPQRHRAERGDAADAEGLGHSAHGRKDIVHRGGVGSPTESVHGRTPNLRAGVLHLLSLLSLRDRGGDLGWERDHSDLYLHGLERCLPPTGSQPKSRFFVCEHKEHAGEGHHQLSCRDELEGIGEELVRLSALQPALVSIDLCQDGRRAVRDAVDLDAGAARKLKPSWAQLDAELFADGLKRVRFGVPLVDADVRVVPHGRSPARHRTRGGGGGRDAALGAAVSRTARGIARRPIWTGRALRARAAREPRLRRAPRGPLSPRVRPDSAASLARSAGPARRASRVAGMGGRVTVAAPWQTQ